MQQIYFQSRADFREWLVENHKTSNGIWMVFYKKNTGKQNMDYAAAAEEAICFGWIDSIVKKLDKEKYLRKFTPRTNTLNWSFVNRKRVLKLIENGRMTEAGLNKIDQFIKTGKIDRTFLNVEDKFPENTTLPEFLRKEFADNEPALKNFKQLAKSYQKLYIHWIMSAKKEKTVQKRIKESIKLLKQNKKLGMK